jgi:hypothetical protein
VGQGSEVRWRQGRLIGGTWARRSITSALRVNDTLLRCTIFSGRKFGAARAKVHFQSVQRLEASDSVGEMTNQAFDHIQVHVHSDGNIWIFHRCFNPVPPGIAACVGRGDANPPILQFDPSGKLLKRPEPRSVVSVLLVLRDDVVPGFAHDFSSTIDGMFAKGAIQSDALTLRIFVIRLVGSDLRASRFCRTWLNRPPNRRFYG